MSKEREDLLKEKFLGKYIYYYNPEYDEESTKYFYKVRDIYDPNIEEPEDPDEEVEEYDGPEEYTFCSNVWFEVGNDGTMKVEKSSNYEEVNTLSPAEIVNYVEILDEKDFYEYVEGFNRGIKEFIEHKPYWEE